MDSLIDVQLIFITLNEFLNVKDSESRYNVCCVMVHVQLFSPGPCFS